jgi:hypothetical protein
MIVNKSDESTANISLRWIHAATYFTNCRSLSSFVTEDQGFAIDSGHQYRSDPHTRTKADMEVLMEADGLHS